MIYPNKKYIIQKSGITVSIILATLLLLTFLIYKSIKTIELNDFKSLTIVIQLILPITYAFLIFTIIRTILKYLKKVNEFGVCTFEIKDESFIYIDKKGKYHFDSQNLPKSMRRNFESFIFETEKNKVIILFKDYVLKKEEIEKLKQDFDKLKNYLFN